MSVFVTSKMFGTIAIGDKPAAVENMHSTGTEDAEADRCRWASLHRTGYRPTAETVITLPKLEHIVTGRGILLNLNSLTSTFNQREVVKFYCGGIARKCI